MANGKKLGSKVILALCAVVILGLGIYGYFGYYFKFGEGTKAGILNQFVYKGLVWKTYEGRLIMEGYREGMQSNQFEFSVEDTEVADQLMKLSGKYVNLQYKEFFNPLPWRGHQKYVVYKILEIRPTPGAETDSPVSSIMIEGVQEI